MTVPARRIAHEGIVAGLLGAVAVAISLALWSLSQAASPFFVPSSLGSALLGQPPGAGPRAIPIAVYSAAHVVVAILIGWFAAALVNRVEHHHVLWYLFGYLLMVGLLYSVMLMGAIGVEATHQISWTAVVVANLVGLLVTGWWLWSRHRQLFDAIAQEGVDAGMT